jgi:hypothetical protein
MRYHPMSFPYPVLLANESNGKYPCNWEMHGEGSGLLKNFLKEPTFCLEGYLVCSIGEASPETLRKLILSQGYNHPVPYIPQTKDLLVFTAPL